MHYWQPNQHFSTKTRDAWLEHLGAFDVLRAPVYNYAEVFADPQVEHNAMVVEQQHPTAGPIKVINTPMKFSETPAQLGPAAPRLGEHTQGGFKSGLGMTRRISSVCVKSASCEVDARGTLRYTRLS